jgi:RNA polymerase primary sigma factor
MDEVSIYMQDLGRMPVMSSKDETTAFSALREGDDSMREKIARANLRFVVSVAGDYASDSSSFMDLVQDGNMGLLKAIDKFDHNKGFKFITYAVWWIRRSILDAIQRDRTIRLPKHAYEDMRRCSIALNEYNRDILRAARESVELSDQRVDNVRQLSNNIMSIDYNNVDDEASQSNTWLRDDSAARDMEYGIEMDELRDKFTECFNHLDKRASYIIKSYYGLCGHDACTLESIGERMNLTRERVRQIKKIALRRLKLMIPESYHINSDEAEVDVDELLKIVQINARRMENYTEGWEDKSAINA